MTFCTAGYHNSMRQLLVSVEEQDWERLQQVAQRANCTAEELIARILRPSASACEPSHSGVATTL
jgi:predicted DNA-binding ribbon-helix-helix protein